MPRPCRPLICAFTAALSAGALFGQAEAPAVVSSGPLPFVGITPCRLIDTRNAAMPPGYGPPSISPGVPAARTFVIAEQCGISGTAEAISLNVTVTNTLGTGYIVLYPEGSSLPPVSTLNYFGGQTVANSAIVPVGAGGFTVVAGVSGTDLIVDVNGYYAGGTGISNTFVGDHAGSFATSGRWNTGFGSYALNGVATGEANTAVGFLALTDGNDKYRNTAVGRETLRRLAGFAVNNIAIGASAGSLLQTGNYNIYIGHDGTTTETGTIRIGRTSDIARAFVAGIRGVTTGNGDAVPVVIDSAGQLGTLSSSARTKQDVESMADASSALLRLRPVRFRYRGQSGDRTHFGLIAEEVDEVLPELVVHDASGNAETVLYHEMPAMLLNELQKQQAEIDRLNGRLADLEARLTPASRD